MLFYNPSTTEVFNKQKDYTLSEGDHGNVVTFDSDVDLVCYIPAGLRIGFSCSVLQLNTGRVRFIVLDPNYNNINNGAAGVETKNSFDWAKVLCIATGKYVVDYSDHSSGAFILESQFRTSFSIAVDEETDNGGQPAGTGSITVTKI